MVASLFALTAAALVCAGSAAAKTYAVHETYNSSNFFDNDKFNFFESNFNTGNYNDVDPNSGFVNYYSKENALASGLVSQKGGEVYLGVDHHATSWTKGGRPSVRLESHKLYKKGLFIARFTHLPDNKCGTWPAFWMFGEGWPNGGEIDIYENFNNAEFNHPTFHTGKTHQVGACNLDSARSTGNMRRSSCDWDPYNLGCGVTDKRGPYATKGGGVFAMEWTDDYIRIFTWYDGLEPADIASDYPDTSKWGLPTAWLKDTNCPIDPHFGPQKLVLNIDFCGAAAGNADVWKTMCKAETGVDNCQDYVRNNPSVFADVFFKVKDIRYFTESNGKPTTTKASSTSISSSTKLTSTSKSTTTSSTTTSSTSISSTSISSTSTSPTSTSSASSVLSTSSKQSSSISSMSIPTTVLVSSSTISTKPTQTEQSTSTSMSSSSPKPTSTKQLTSTSGSTTSDESTSIKQSTASLGSTSSAQATSVEESTTTSSILTPSVEPTSTRALTSTSSVQPTSANESSTPVSSIVMSLSSPSSVKPTSVKTTNNSHMNSTTTSTANTQQPTLGSSSGSVTASSQQTTLRSMESKSLRSTSVPVSQTGVSSAATGGGRASSMSTSSVEMTTSTVYTTTIHTVSTCPPAVSNCPNGVYVTTEVIPAYTTVCPVSEAAMPHTTDVPLPDDETATSKVTKIFTVTSCPPSVTDCFIGKVTTEQVSAVVCEGNCAGGNVPSQVISLQSSMVTPVTSVAKTTSATSCEGENCQGALPGSNEEKPNSQGCDGNNCAAVDAATQTLSGSVCIGQECHTVVNSGGRAVISASVMVGSTLILILAF